MFDIKQVVIFGYSKILLQLVEENFNIRKINFGIFLELGIKGITE